jgi:hypothetical protein
MKRLIIENITEDTITNRKNNKGFKMKKSLVISILTASVIFANDSVVMSEGDVVVKDYQRDETIVISDSADRDSLIVNENSIVISNKKPRPYYNNYRPASQPVAYAQPKEYWDGTVEDMSYDSVEVKHSGQTVGTAEVPVVYRLHPHTVHQYK